MSLQELSLKDKQLFLKYLSRGRHELSVYAFANIYIWKALFRVRWLIFQDNLLIFFQDRSGCFLYLPPLASKTSPAAAEAAFRVMDSFNKNKAVSRIENIEANDVEFYRSLGYRVYPKPAEYLCRRASLAALKGDSFKSKRACCNYFLKNYRFVYAPFSLSDARECLRLYRSWLKERASHNRSLLYRGMLEDGLKCLRLLLKNFSSLGTSGRVVRVNAKLRAFSFGFPLNSDTFCLLYEVADLSLRGLAQFIFREFCRDAGDFVYLNMMDDSGLENLRRVKFSYHPLREIPAYVAAR
jgi:hypothetical protein